MIFEMSPGLAGRFGGAPGAGAARRSGAGGADGVERHGAAQRIPGRCRPWRPWRP